MRATAIKQKNQKQWSEVKGIKNRPEATLLEIYDFGTVTANNGKKRKLAEIQNASDSTINRKSDHGPERTETATKIARNSNIKPQKKELTAKDIERGKYRNKQKHQPKREHRSQRTEKSQQ